MSTTKTVNVNQFKCVPLDLIRNVDASGDIKVNVTSNDVSLQEITKDTQEDIASGGQIDRAPFDAKKISNIIILFAVLGIIIFTILVYFTGIRNFNAFVKEYKLLLIGIFGTLFVLGVGIGLYYFLALLLNIFKR